MGKTNLAVIRDVAFLQEALLDVLQGETLRLLR